MKKLILLLFFTAFISVTAQIRVCPDYLVEYHLWTETSTINGCEVTYTYCKGVDASGYLYVTLIAVDFGPGCDPNTAYNSDLIDDILKEILLSDEMAIWLNDYGLKIPPCPNTLCVLRLNDKICHKGWIYNEESKKWEMQTCGNFGSCAETTRFCWIKNPETGERELTIERFGASIGEPCPEGCSSDCDF